MSEMYVKDDVVNILPIPHKEKSSYLRPFFIVSNVREENRTCSSTGDVLALSTNAAGKSNGAKTIKALIKRDKERTLD